MNTTAHTPEDASAVSQTALEVIGLSLLMVDAHGRLRYANAHGHRDLARQDILRLEGGRVVGVGPEGLRQFTLALQAAGAGARSVLTLGPAETSLAVVPMHRCPCPVDAQRVLVTWSGDAPNMGLTLHLFAKALGLAPGGQDEPAERPEGGSPLLPRLSSALARHWPL
ncbi:hypothetical protein [Ideonella livida]|uniref:PAS fold-4 domain-containing protein n=1 Tax=Ideonella livida TaxID=2707176 RepID=A0A7C9TJ93_9BURK|nr:hypothetical protein [Ideonella livida]NDY90445.1 hypothetical protein [Ideonella livida]